MSKALKTNLLSFLFLTIIASCLSNETNTIIKLPISPSSVDYSTKNQLSPTIPVPKSQITSKSPLVPKMPSPPLVKIEKDYTIVKSSNIPDTKYPIKIIRSDNKEIIINKSPEKIIAFDSAAVEILYSINAGNKIVGTHSFVTYPEDSKNITKVGDAFNLNIEKVLSLNPDLFYIFFERYINDLEKNNIKVIYEKTLNDNFEAIPSRILMWGKIVNKNNEAYNTANQFEIKLFKIKSFFKNYQEGPTIFYDTGSLWTPGNNTLVGKTFNLLKLNNIAKDVSGYKQFSKEILIKKDPQIIVTSDPDFFYKNTEFKNLTAIKNKRILTLDSDSLSIAGPRFIDGIEELIEKIYSPVYIDNIYEQTSKQ